VSTDIDRRELDQLLADGAQLVETLPEKEYNDGHLPGAISLPLRQLTPERAAVLDRVRPVVVYCWDSL
jgi:rhodanese-related sulfurtransferase